MFPLGIFDSFNRNERQFFLAEGTIALLFLEIVIRGSQRGRVQDQRAKKTHHISLVLLGMLPKCSAKLTVT